MGALLATTKHIKSFGGGRSPNIPPTKPISVYLDNIYQVGRAGERVSLAAAGLPVAEHRGGEPVYTHLYQPAGTDYNHKKNASIAPPPWMRPWHS